VARKISVPLVSLLTLLLLTCGNPVPLTLTIGSGPIALVQNGSVVETVLSADGFASGSIAATLPVASTAGTTLILIMSSNVQANLASPAGFTGITNLAGTAIGVTTIFKIAVYPNNPGGIIGVTVQATGPVGTGTYWAHLSEWSGVASASVLDTSGTATAVAGTTLTPSTAAAVVNPGELAVVGWTQKIATNTATFTSPSGWTRLADSGALSRDTHLDAEYLIGPNSGPPLAPVLTSNRTTTDAGGVIVLLKRAPQAVDMSAFIAY